MKTKSDGFTLLAGGLLAALALAAQTAQAQHGLGVQNLDVPHFAHVGDTITAKGTITDTDISGDDWVITNIFVTVFRNGEPMPPSCPTSIIPIPVPGATNVLVTDPCFGTTTTVLGLRIHAGNTFQASATFTVPDCDGEYSFLPNEVTAVGIDTMDHSSPNCPFGDLAYSDQDVMTVLRPCISCIKTCTTVRDGGTASVNFSGSVSNCGNIALTNVTVIDNQPVANTVVTNFSNTVLLPNHTFTYSGSYRAMGGLNVDNVTVSGTEFQFDQVVVQTVSSSCSSTCLANNTLFATKADASNLSVSFATETGRTYTVQFTASLSPADWQTLTNLPGDGAVATVLDSSTNAQRFYRVLTQ